MKWLLNRLHPAYWHGFYSRRCWLAGKRLKSPAFFSDVWFLGYYEGGPPSVGLSDALDRSVGETIQRRKLFDLHRLLVLIGARKQGVTWH